MIQTPNPLAPLARLKATAMCKAKSGVRHGVRLVGKSPALKKFLIRTIKRFPAIERCMRASANSFDATTAHRAGTENLSLEAQLVLRRLRQAMRKKN